MEDHDVLRIALARCVMNINSYTEASELLFSWLYSLSYFDRGVLLFMLQ